MSEMNVSMRLTLQDSATAGLKGVVDLLGSLSEAAKPANEGLQALARRLSSIGTAAEKSGGGIGRMETAIGGIVEALRAFETKLGAAVDGFAQFGAVAKDSAANVSQAATAIGRATTKLDGVAASTRAAKTEMAGFGETIKGIAAAWGALKIEHGLKKSVETGADMARLQAQMRAMGYNQDAVKYATQRSWDLSRQFPMVSARDAMGGWLALQTGTGTNNEQLFNAALPTMLRNAVAYRANFNRSASLQDIIGNMVGLAELRGLSQSASGLISVSNQALQVAEATGGRMKIGQQEVVGRQTKYGGAQLLTDAGYKQMMAMAEQFTLAGHEGGSGGGRGVSQMGTAVSMFLKVMNGGKMAKQTFEMLKAMDMWTKGTTTLATSTTQTATTGNLRNALEGQGSPLQWAHDVLVPRMLAYAMKNAKEYFPKGNTSDPRAQLEALNKIAIQTWGPTGGVNVANLASMVANPEVWGRVENTVQRSNNAPTDQNAVQQLSPWDKGVQKLSAAFDNLKNSVGAGLLPTLTKAVNVFAAILKPVGTLLHAVPGLGEAVGVLGAALTALLSIQAAKWFLGITSIVRGIAQMFRMLPRGAAEAASGVKDAAATMSSRFGTSISTMAAMALRFANVVAIAFTLYEAGENIKIFGVTINNHIRIALVAAVGQFDRFFTWLNTASDRAAASFFGAISGAAKAVGASGLADWAKGHQVTLSAAAATFQKNFDQRESTRVGEVGWYMSPQAQPGYERPAHGAPNSAEADRKLQQWLAEILKSFAKGVPDMSNAPHRGRAHRPVNPQDLAQGWGMQDLRRATREAAAQLDAWNREVAKAKKAVEDATAKESSAGIRSKWGGYASTLAAAGQTGLAAQAQQQGDKLANKFDLKQAQDHLKSLQSDLRNREQTNAALVTGGVLTPDQAQQRTLADQKAAVPQLLAAAEAVKKYEQAIGQSTTGIDATIAKISELGTALTQFGQKIKNTFESTFQNLFSSVMKGQKSWKQMGIDFVNQLLNGINQTVSQKLAQSFTDALFGPKTGTGQAFRNLTGSGGGDLFSNLGGMLGHLLGGGSAGAGGGGGGLFATLGSMFSGSSLGAAMQYGSGIGSQQSAMLAAQDAGLSGSSGTSLFSGFADWIGKFFGSFAVGADYIPHDMVAKIHQGEMIVPKAGADAIRSGALGGGHTVNLSIHAMDSQSVLGAMDGIKRELAGMLLGTNQALNLGM